MLLLRALARNWWLMLLRGICAILFGVLSLAWPGITIQALVFVFAAYAMLDGVLALIAAVKGDAPAPRWWLALVGVLGVCTALVAALNPGLTAVALLYLIAAWALAVGLLEIVGAVRLRKEISNEWMLIASGLVTVLLAIALMLRPAAGAVALAFLIGACAIVFGVTMIVFSLRLRGAAMRTA